MGWFDEQIRRRRKNDQALFEDTLLRMAYTAIGGKNADSVMDERVVTKEAVDDILRFYHRKPAEIPESVKLPEEQLEFALRPHGIMHRTVVLTEKWLPCVPYMRVFCVTYMFYPVHTANLNAIKAMGRSDLFLKLEIIKKTIAEDSIVFEKKVKKGGFKTINVTDNLKDFEITENNGDILLKFNLPAGNDFTVSPVNFCNALSERLNRDDLIWRITRHKLLMKNGKDFI